MAVVKILEKRLKACWVCILFLCYCMGHSQTVNSLKLLDFRYGFQAPLADMKDRFGGNNTLGLGVEISSFKTKMIFGVEGITMFGNNVKEDVLAPLRTYDGNIIGIDNRPGDVNLKERGWYAGVFTGRIFKTTKHEGQLTGLRVQLGLGLLQHKIRVQDNYNSIVPLNKEYINGYDRLTNGPAIHFGLGYQYDSPVNNFHFRIMGEVYGGKTKSRRDLDYATGTYLSADRTDILYGLHIAYIVTISRTTSEEFIYY